MTTPAPKEETITPATPTEDVDNAPFDTQGGTSVVPDLDSVTDDHDNDSEAEDNAHDDDCVVDTRDNDRTALEAVSERLTEYVFVHLVALLMVPPIGLVGVYLWTKAISNMMKTYSRLPKEVSIDVALHEYEYDSRTAMCVSLAAPVLVIVIVTAVLIVQASLRIFA